MTALKPSEILSRAADLIEPEGAWTQGWFARDATGTEVSSDNAGARCWCAAGAINRTCVEVTDHAPSVALEYLSQALGSDVADWNDRDGRTQSEVVAALRKASTLALESGE